MSELKPSEAIEILESIYPSKKQIVTGEYPDVAEALDLAINTLRHAGPVNDPLTKYEISVVRQLIADGLSDEQILQALREM